MYECSNGQWRNRKLRVEQLEDRQLLSAQPGEANWPAALELESAPYFSAPVRQTAAQSRAEVIAPLPGTVDILMSAALGDVNAMQNTQPAASAAIAQDERVFNVRDFGAIGDGRADDSLAITAALTAAHDAGGGNVYFPAGTYIAQGLPIYEKVFHVGDGVGITLIRLPSTPTDHLFKALPGDTFNYGGFRDLTLNGMGTSQYDGISFADITGWISSYQIDHVELIDFRNGYHGAVMEYQVMMSNSLFASNQNAGVMVFENPFISNCRFNGNMIGLSGRLADAMIVGSYFSSNVIGAMPVQGDVFRQSTFVGNIFVGNTIGGLVIDEDNTLTGNVFTGSLRPQHTYFGVVIRGNDNTISDNKIGLESGQPNTISQGFSLGGLYFSPIDYRGVGQAFGQMGYNTVISGNVFACQNGPGIVGPSGVGLTGMAIRGNSFNLWNQQAIAFNNSAGRNTFGNLISGNAFVIKANTTLAPVEVSTSALGNTYLGNQFVVLGGISAGAMLKIDARRSLIMANRMTNVSRGQSPYDLLRTDSMTRLMYNLATDGDGKEVGATQASGMVTINPTTKSLPIVFNSPLALAPTADDIHLIFASNPFEASAIWPSNISANGFTLNLNLPPSGGNVYVAWKVLLT